MLCLHDPGLDAKTAQGLNAYQAKVDRAGVYAEQVAAGSRLFGSYSHRGNRVFDVVRHTLEGMCFGIQRCGYCEDSVGDQIEHIRPKSLYPERTFVWENYLPACGGCNRAKGTDLSVFDSDGGLVNVARRRGDPVLQPAPGTPVLIDPRHEDPLMFLALEIEETFLFLPRENLDGADETRAEYTIKLLKLNRDVLSRARRQAYGHFRARLVEYRRDRDSGASAAQLRTKREAIRTCDHPTVWREMQRQQNDVPELRRLFTEVPEALRWVS